jgi:hypothetical protein
MRMRFSGILLLAGLGGGSIFAETVARPAVIPIEAELMADLEARHLTTGETLFAKVLADWNGLGCVLRQGAVLEAKVVSVVPHSKTSKASEVALSFANAQCGESAMEPFTTVLVAVAAPQEDESSVAMDMPRALGSSAPSAGAGSGFRSMTSTDADIWWNMQHLFPPNVSLHAGRVYGINWLKLSAGTGPLGSSVLSSKDRNVALDKHTLLLLVPGSLVITSAKTQGEGAPGAATAVVPNRGPGTADAGHIEAGEVNSATDQPSVEEDEICTPPECSIAAPTGDPEDGRNAAGSISGSISIQALGYTSRPQKEMGALNHDETLIYLSPRELLVTFNPHSLVPRHGVTTAGSTVRVIRAALVDVDSKKVKRTVDWYLPDANQYLWLLANHRVLVHVGNELRVYGPGLNVEARIPLSDSLSFVRTDPAGKVIAFGVVKERHTPELHAKLRENLEKDPEEDVQIQVLNEKFETIATAMSTSARIPPTLLNEGEVKLLLQPDNRIHLVLHTWDNQWRILTRFVSGCTPQVSSLAPDLVFLVSCNMLTEGREFRVLRADGRLVLKGQSPLVEMGHSAIGSQDTKEFAVEVLKSDQPVPPGAVFRPVDLQTAEIGIYREVDGKRITNVRAKAPSGSENNFAFAPDGRQLAVLTRDLIELYSLPQN